MKQKEVIWGSIGCGDVLEIKSGPAFKNAENSSFLAVMSRNEEKVKNFAKRHKIPNWYTNVDELLANKSINSIYIATPPSSHLKYTLQALEAGKNVYLEKPMVLNSKESNILLDALKSKENKVTVAHYRRKLQVFSTTKELIETNILGTISSVEITIAQSKKANLIVKTADNWRLNPEVSGGGYFHDIAPHQIDLMCYYFGEVDAIKGIDVEKNKQSNEVVKGFIQFENGVQFKGSWNFKALKDIDNCTIYGEKGTISFSFYGEEITVSVDGKEETYQFESPKHIQQPMIEKTIGYFLGKNGNPCSVKEAAMVTEIMDAFCGIK